MNLGESLFFLGFYLFNEGICIVWVKVRLILVGVAYGGREVGVVIWGEG